MHNHYYFLRQISEFLHLKLKGYTLVSCFSQHKDELIIEFNNAQKSFFIKANMEPGFCCLSFPAQFSRARKNCVDLFSEVLMQPVVSVTQSKNERSFAIGLRNDHSLVFKMHGNFANVILFIGVHAQSLFRNHLKSDLQLPLQPDREIDWSRDSFLQRPDTLEKKYFTFGREVWQYLNDKGFASMKPEQQWDLLTSVRQLLENPQYYLLEEPLRFSLLPGPFTVSTWQDPILAINEFYNRYISFHGYEKEKGNLLKTLDQQIQSGQNYLQKNQAKLQDLQDDHHYQEWADLVMAHMHEMKTGMDCIILDSFYDGKPITIRLKKELSPLKNAEVFYRKGKNQEIEIVKLTESIQFRKREIEQLLKRREEVEAITELKALRLATQTIPDPKKIKKTNEARPYHEFGFKGFKIWVGKNAEANDELTLKYAHKDDLWLHVKDVAGSHVIVKHQSGKSFPKDVIERAAELAAYNSKRRTETLCAVIVTEKKFVRKKKGAPAGSVIVEKEETLLVKPASKNDVG